MKMYLMNVFIKEGAMPKIIDDLRESLLREARRMLLQDGGRALTIRRYSAFTGSISNILKWKS